MDEKFMKVLREQQEIQQKAARILHDTEKMKEEVQNKLESLKRNRKIEHYHHIIPKSKNGSDTIDNIAGLCRCCHDKVHKNEKEAQRLQKKKKGLNKKYGALSVLNQAIPFICKRLEEEFGAEHSFKSGLP